MKAMLSKAIGGPDTLVLEEVTAPVAGPGQAVVAIKACGVNFPDTLMIEDRYQTKPPRPFAPGGEISGVVTALGQGVSHLKLGDRVLGMCGSGGMAEQIAIPGDKLTVIPDAMPFDEAAAFLFTYGTSFHALKDRGRLQPGETLLVLGAAGGVGLAAVELGKAMGARVVAACSTAEKVAAAKARGADAGVVYGTGPFDRDAQKALTEAFKAACGPDGAHVIYDAVGGAYAEPALRAIAWEGRYLVVGFTADIPKIPLNLVLLKGCQIVGVFLGAWTERNPGPYAQTIQDLLALYTAGKVKPYISKHFPLEQAGLAIAELGERRAVGKVVVMVG